MPTILISSIAALWVVAIAIISVQNATPTSLQFLAWHSIKIPVGVVLAASVGAGMVGGAIAPSLWRRPRR